MNISEIQQKLSSKTLIFPHIPKTAGTTLRSVILSQYSQEKVHFLKVSQTPLEAAQKISESDNKRVHCYVGHMPYGLHKYLAKPAIYITLIREPVDRIISMYYFIREEPAHRLHNEFLSKDISLEDFVLSRNCPRNEQVKKIAGSMVGSAKETMDLAYQNICNHFLAVGTQENFDDFLQVLQKILGWKNKSYTKQKVTKNRKNKREVSQELIDIIKERNGMDIAFYNNLKNKFTIKNFDYIVSRTTSKLIKNEW
ncbi:MAG: sulfotransferase family protein [Okeania sp. SIO2F4]|uniref:sulfotransferase family 2 domain-containing protein n=1 Tax=Okeania sp. SIO2F4 TaxID=2607790 RepID=UPI00142BF4C3|nr:sulfotransferase family 2 domain-containing protein [Okeania sp. SIO2F4]NES01420.1 sulfotransferase family protein [Okeania sp. SIO2F4]